MANGKKRWGLIGLLTAGAAVGAIGAMFARRRRTAQWHQYEPSIDDIGFADAQSADGRITATTKRVAAGAAAVAETVSTQAGKIADTLHEKTGFPAAGSPSSGPSTPGSPSPASGSSAPGSSTSGSSTSASSSGAHSRRS